MYTFSTKLFYLQEKALRLLYVNVCIVKWAIMGAHKCYIMTASQFIAQIGMFHKFFMNIDSIYKQILSILKFTVNVILTNENVLKTIHW